MLFEFALFSSFKSFKPRRCTFFILSLQMSYSSLMSSSSSPDIPDDPIDAPIIRTEELPHLTSISHPPDGTIYIVRDEPDVYVRISENRIK